MGRRKEKNYMIRSEKRPNYRSPTPVRQQKRKKSPAGYTVLTLILLVLLYPVGLVLLWIKRIQWNWIVKLLTTLVTGFAFFLLMSYLLTVPVQNETIAQIQQQGKARVDQLYDAGADWAEQGREALNTSMNWVGQRLSEAGNFIGDQAEALLDRISGAPTPEPSEPPEASESPEATGMPKATATPKAAATPKATETPKATGTPKATATPKASESPKATGTPEATATPRATGTPGATATPSITLAPMPSPTAQEPVMVWVAGDNSYYHAGYDCEGLSGAHQIALNDAVSKGYIACNRCSPPELSMEEMLKLLPKEQADQLRATLTSAAPTAEASAQPTVEASAQPTVEASAAPAKEPVSIPEPEVTPKPASEILVWHSLPGKGSYYHLDENCSGMYGARQYSLQSSVEQGFKRCNKCGAPDLAALEGQTVVWVDKDDKMHITDECPAGQGAQFMILEDVLKQGTELEYCEECGAGAYMEYRGAYLEGRSEADADLSTAEPESAASPIPGAEASAAPTAYPAAPPKATFRPS